ncbi:hypothetical protein ACX80N_07200 [Arthrobacter sp. MDT2-16]
MSRESQQRSARCAARSAGLTAENSWSYYYSVGGTLDILQLDAYLHGLYPLAQAERNTVALALNELIDDLPRPGPKAEFVHAPWPDGPTRP